MCKHYGDPTEACPLCECGCGSTPGVYAFSGRGGAKAGKHKRYYGSHAGRSVKKTKPGPIPNDAQVAKPEGADALIARLLEEALASGAVGDDLVKVFIDSNELAAAIVLAQVQKALSGNVQSANWLFSRGIGTARQKSSSASKTALSFGNPLESVDVPYE